MYITDLTSCRLKFDFIRHRTAYTIRYIITFSEAIALSTKRTPRPPRVVVTTARRTEENQTRVYLFYIVYRVGGNPFRNGRTARVTRVSGRNIMTSRGEMKTRPYGHEHAIATSRQNSSWSDVGRTVGFFWLDVFRPF